MVLFLTTVTKKVESSRLQKDLFKSFFLVPGRGAVSSNGRNQEAGVGEERERGGEIGATRGRMSYGRVEIRKSEKWKQRAHSETETGLEEASGEGTRSIFA